MAFQQWSSLTIHPEPNGQWCWTIQHAGQTVLGGTPPASGPARFNVLGHAADSLVLNSAALLRMAHDQRRRERAALSTTTQPSPGQ